MTNETERRPITIILLIILLVFLGLGGFVGGIPMQVDPTGSSMGLPAGLLENLPIDNFVLPGLFLIVVMGIIPIVIAVGVWRRSDWAWVATLAIGGVLVLWILFQFILWGEPIAIQYFYLMLGLVIFAMGWLPSTRRYLHSDR